MPQFIAERSARMLALAFTLLILGAAAPSILHAATLAEEAQSLQAPRLSAPLASPKPIAFGRAVITPRPGTSVRRMLAGDEPCGLYVDGPADFVYRVEDRFSQPVAQRNLRRASRLDALLSEGALTVTSEIRWALIWSLELGNESGVQSAASVLPLPEDARTVLTRPFFAGPGIELLTARHLPSPGLTYALLHSSAEDLLLEVDPGLAHGEALYRVVRVGVDDSRTDAGRYFLRELAAQPMAGHQWWEQFRASVVVSHEAFEVVNDRSTHVAIQSLQQIQGIAPSTGLFCARLREPRDENGEEYPVQVLSVTVNGRAAEFVHRDSHLFVRLDPPILAGQTAELRVAHEGEYAQRFDGDNFWSLRTWPWYPKPPFNGELATLELTVRVPPPFMPFASGQTVAREVVDGRNVLRTKLDKPMSWPVIAAGKYHLFSDTHAGLTARVATYGLPDERGAKRLLNNFFAAEECYHKKLNAEFPFPELTILEVNDWGWGQAPSGMIFITREAFNTILDPTAQAYSEGINERFFHEIAHAYWAHLLKFPSVDENWLSESFASYSAALCLDATSGGRGGFKMENAVRRWKSATKELGDGASVYLAERLAGKGFRDATDRRTLLYAKGPLVLHALRLELGKRAGSQTEGDRQFLILLRSFLKNFPFQWGTTLDFTAILNQITKSDWQPWFERYVYGTETPDVP